MATLIINNYTHLSSSFTKLKPQKPKPPKPKTTNLCLSSKLMEPSSKFFEFPHVTEPHRQLMVGLMSKIETQLGHSNQLAPCTLPPDVQYCVNETGSAQASLHIRSGRDGSLVDIILGSWIHCKLPTGSSLNITSLSGYLNSLTDVPNFVFELIQSSPTSLVMILDLPPRKDLVLDPQYLQKFYEDTQLDTQRQAIAKLTEAKPYVSSSLYIRGLLSPTAIAALFDTSSNDDGARRMEEIIRDHLDPVASEVLGIWLAQCAHKNGGGSAVVLNDQERDVLVKRDSIVKTKTIEIDLGSSFPRLFGEEATNRLLGAIKDAYSLY